MATIFRSPQHRLLLLAAVLVAGAVTGALAGAPSPAFLLAAALVVTLTLVGALTVRRQAAGTRPPDSIEPELLRLAWSAAFLLIVLGTLFASGLYH